MKKCLFIIFMLIIFAPIVNAENELNISAKSAILMESSTGQILFELNKDEPLPPASMTKVMSMLLFMEALENKTISLNDQVVISANAASMGGSQAYLEEGKTYLVEDLIKSIAVASANDSVVALAEKTYGSVEAFVNKMNEKAKELNMNNTTYKNPHGLDEDGHVTTAYDMATVARELLKHEEILKYTSIYEYYMPKPDGTTTWLVNTNKLIRFYNGIDGLKTGYTKNALYCLTATAKKNNMRLISVVMGEDSSEIRNDDTIKILNYGFNGYKLTNILTSDKSLGTIKIKKSIKETADVYLKNDVNIISKNTANNNYKYNIKLKKVTAPVSKNDIVGTIVVKDESNKTIWEEDLIIKENIKKASFLDYFKYNFRILTLGMNKK